jgi:hypothetical protein
MARTGGDESKEHYGQDQGCFFHDIFELVVQYWSIEGGRKSNIKRMDRKRRISYHSGREAMDGT